MSERRPMIPGLTGHERTYVRTLVRRAQVLRRRIDESGGRYDAGGNYDRSELSAVRWALGRILTPEECQELGVPEEATAVRATPDRPIPEFLSRSSEAK